MDEIRLWKRGPAEGLRAVRAVSRLDTEIELEELLVAHPELLEDGLTLVGRQAPTAGGWLDLLGVDRDGRLVIFELKRGSLGRDAVTQVLDYASDLSAKSVESIVEHLEARTGKGGVERIPDFATWYGEKFDDLQGLLPVRMALVGLGVDETALRIARFLGEAGRTVEVITFYGFRDGDDTLLARQVPVPPLLADERTRTKAEGLERHLEECGLRERFDTVRQALREGMPDAVVEETGKYGVGLQLDVVGDDGVRRRRTHFGVYAAYSGGGVVDVSLGLILKNRYRDGYRRLKKSVKVKTWPHGAGAIHIESDDDWKRVRGPLCEFAAAVSRDWEQSGGTPAG